MLPFSLELRFGSKGGYLRRLHRDTNRLSSLRMGITQYDEVPAEYVSLLVENYTNAVWISWQQRPPIFEMSACGHLITLYNKSLYPSINHYKSLYPTQT